VTIEIANESGVAVDEVALASVARFALDQLRIHPLAELSVLLVDETAMADLHVKWMDEPGPTDVLSFPMDELRPPSMGGAHGSRAGGDESGPEPGLLGDVVLCPPVAAAQARQAGHSAQQELEMLCVHGILHLLGYDHADPEEEAEMFGLQGELLKAWREGTASSASPGGRSSGMGGSRSPSPPAPGIPPRSGGLSAAPNPPGPPRSGGLSAPPNPPDPGEGRKGV
jgi:probable rRNA maturation factor